MTGSGREMGNKGWEKSEPRPEVDPWVAIRMGRYVEPLVAEAGLRSDLIAILAETMPRFVEELSRLLEPAAKAVPMADSPRSDSTDTGTVTAPLAPTVSIRHTREIVGDRDDIMEALAVERTKLASGWGALRQWMADTADYFEHLQAIKTPPELMVADILSLLRQSEWTDEVWAGSYKHLIRLAFGLRHLLDDIPESARGDRWDAALLGIGQALSAYRGSGTFRRRLFRWAMSYGHELLVRGSCLPLEHGTGEAAADIMRYGAFMAGWGSLAAKERMARPYTLIEAKYRQKSIKKFRDTSVLQGFGIGDYTGNITASSSFEAMYFKDFSLDFKMIERAVANAAWAILSCDGQPSPTAFIFCARNIDKERFAARLLVHSVGLMACMDMWSVIKGTTPGQRLVEEFFTLLAQCPTEWRAERQRNLLAPLAAAMFEGLEEISDGLRKMLRLFSLPEVVPHPSPAEGFRDLAVEVAKLLGATPPFGDGQQMVVHLLRLALDSAFGAEEVNRAMAEVGRMAGVIMALPDDTCAMVRQLCGPYLDNGPFVAEGVIPAWAWARRVRLSRGEGLPADIGQALRTVFGPAVS